MKTHHECETISSIPPVKREDGDTKNKIMSKRIYVGNLPFNANDDEIRSLFEQYGTVETVHIVMDRETGRPRGFAFVEMSSGVDEAIRATAEAKKLWKGT